MLLNVIITLENQTLFEGDEILWNEVIRRGLFVINWTSIGSCINTQIGIFKDLNDRNSLDHFINIYVYGFAKVGRF